MNRMRTKGLQGRKAIRRGVASERSQKKYIIENRWRIRSHSVFCKNSSHFKLKARIVDTIFVENTANELSEREREREREKMGNVPTVKKDAKSENPRTLISAFDKSTAFQRVLSRGRFLKSAQCQAQDGSHQVIKIYSARNVHGSTKQAEQLAIVSSARDLLLEVKDLVSLRKHPNLMPWQSVKLTQNNRGHMLGFLARQYFLASLFDRLSMRPFLTDVEKRWVVFQLLQAMLQCRDAGITHGDIKTENIVVTSWNWIMLTDFAPFKPTVLPSDEPAPFDYYFDTSGRQSCYLAPERFFSHSGGPTSGEFPQRVTPAMDMFSVGCVICELFRDGKACFELPDLLRYSREGAEPPSLTRALGKISDARVCKLIRSMLQHDPAKRPTAAECVEENVGHGRCFPPYFSSFLFPFMRRVLSGEMTSPDARVWYVCNHYGDIFEHVLGARDPQGEQFFRERMLMFHGDGAASEEADPAEVAEARDAFESPVARRALSAGDLPDLLDLADTFVKDMRAVLESGGASTPASASSSMSSFLNRATGHVKVLRERFQQASGSATTSTLPEAAPEMSPRADAASLQSVLLLEGIEFGSSGEEGAQPDEDNGLIILVSLLCSCIRRVKRTSTKLTALWMLHRFALLSDDDAKLQRVVPYVVSLLSDEVPYVRCSSLRVLVALLMSIETLPPFDSKVFPEYLLPALMRFPADPAESVRLAFAECVPKLAQVSETFLELSRLSLHNVASGKPTDGRTVASPSSSPVPPPGSSPPSPAVAGAAEVSFSFTAKVEGSYDKDLNRLREEFEKVVARMVAQSNENSSLVKMTLLKDVTRLCVFFGRVRTNNFLLPMLITFLNERDDWQLRATFFECIAGVSSFVGPVALQQFLLPCIEQALQDVEELVIERALSCLISIVEMDLIDEPTMVQLATRIIPLLHHPGQCIRDAVIKVITTFVVSSKLDHAAVQIQLVPQLRPFLFDARLESSWLLGSSDDVAATERTLRSLLRPSTTRKTFEAALQWYESKSDSKKGKPMRGSSKLPEISDAKWKDPVGSRDVFLHSAMRARVLNRMRHPNSASQNKSELPQEYGTVLKKHVQAHTLRVPHQCYATLHTSSAAGAASSENHRATLQSYGLLHANAESYGMSPQTADSALLDVERIPAKDAKVAVKRLRSLRVPQLPPDMGALRRRNGEAYSVHSQKGSELVSETNDWKPRTIVTSLHEHSGAVNRIAVSQDCLFFATGSDDGSVRIWLSSRLERGAYSRSMLTYSSQAGRITDVCTIDNTHSIASASDRGSVHVFKVEHAYEANQSAAQDPPASKVNSKEPRRRCLGVSTVLEIDDAEGGICAVRHFNSVAQSLLVYATERGIVHGWDMRARKEAWRLAVGQQAGLITALALASSGHWLCVGTSKGVVIMWDVRFHLVVKVYRHSSRSSIHRIFLHGGFSSKPLVYIAAGVNEACLWNIDSGACKQIFRVLPPGVGGADALLCPSMQALPVSVVDPLSGGVAAKALLPGPARASNEDSIRALATPDSWSSGRPPSALIAAGTDRSIRYWDAVDVASSYAVCEAPDSAASMSRWEMFQQSRELPMSAERMYICQEVTTSKLHNGMVSLSPMAMSRGPVPPSPNHRDCVLDLQAVQPANLRYLLSAGRDGIVKVWG